MKNWYLWLQSHPASAIVDASLASMIETTWVKYQLV